jgi:hypothetical protein
MDNGHIVLLLRHLQSHKNYGVMEVYKAPTLSHTLVSCINVAKPPPEVHWIWTGGLHLKPLRSDYSHDTCQYRMSPHRYHLFLYLPNDPFQQYSYRPNLFLSAVLSHILLLNASRGCFTDHWLRTDAVWKPNINESRRYFWWQRYIRNLFSVWNMAYCIAASISLKSMRCIYTAQQGVVQELRKCSAATAQTQLIQQRL